MTNPQPPQAWSTPIAAVVALAAGGIALAVAAAVLSVDGAGRFIIGCAAAALFGFAAFGGLRRPRLAIVNDTTGPRLAVRGLRGVSTYAPADIIRARLSRTRRLGRSNAMLEIDVRDDGDERLLVFTRWDLGSNPADVMDALTAAGCAGRG